MLKWLWKKLKPGPKEVSKERFDERINEIQEEYRIPEEQLPEYMQDDIGPRSGPADDKRLQE